MGAFSIITERTANLANDIGGYHSRMGGFLSEINEASLIIANETSLNIGVSINRVVEAFERDQENLFIMQSALERIIQRYINAENKNSRKSVGSGSAQNNGDNANSGSHRYQREEEWENRKNRENNGNENSESESQEQVTIDSRNDDQRNDTLNDYVDNSKGKTYKKIYGNNPGANWCAYYARYAAEESGYEWPDAELNGSTCSTVAAFQSIGRWHNRSNIEWKCRGGEGTGEDDGYIPKPGDFVAIDNNGSLSDGPEHTAIVIEVDYERGVIITAEGNMSNKDYNKSTVKIREYSIDTLKTSEGDATIVGFGEAL